MTPKAELMARKRAADRAAGRRNVTTPLPEEVIAGIDAERNNRRLMTRGDVIAAIFTEWQEMKSAQEQATT